MKAGHTQVWPENAPVSLVLLERGDVHSSMVVGLVMRDLGRVCYSVCLKHLRRLQRAYSTYPCNKDGALWAMTTVKGDSDRTKDKCEICVSYGMKSQEDEAYAPRTSISRRT